MNGNVSIRNLERKDKNRDASLMTNGQKVFNVFNLIILTVLGMLCLIPFWHVICLSFSDAAPVLAGNVSLWPVRFTLSSYQYVLERHAFWNSFLITLKRVALGVPINLLLVIMTAYPLSKWMDRAAARNMNPRMLVEFVDGSKTMIEMAAVANATGLVPDVRGMHGPHCNVKDLTSVFSLTSQGGVLSKSGVVDYAIGDINPGVFVIVTTDNQRIIDGLVQRDMGNGPNYLLFRPYHLCSIETPITAVQSVLYGESTAHPMDHLTAECITVAKKDLQAGEVLDGIGEFCYRASIDTYGVAKAGRMLPVGLAKGAKLKCDVPMDGVITYDMVELSDASVLLQLRRMQDQLLG